MTTAEVGQPRCSAVRCGCSVAPAKIPHPRTQPAAPMNTPDRIASHHRLHHQETKCADGGQMSHAAGKCWNARCCRQFRTGMRHEDRHRSLFRTPRRGAALAITLQRRSSQPGSQRPGRHYDLKAHLASWKLLLCWSRLCAFGSEQAAAAIRR